MCSRSCRNDQRPLAATSAAVPFLGRGRLIKGRESRGGAASRDAEGGLRSYRHAGFGSEYERDRLIDVVEGRVVGEWLRLNPPEPILYRIDPAGGRTRVADYRDAKPLDDPFAPDETPKGHVFWGRPEDFGESDGYETCACLTYGRPG